MNPPLDFVDYFTNSSHLSSNTDYYINLKYTFNQSLDGELSYSLSNSRSFMALNGTNGDNLYDGRTNNKAQFGLAISLVSLICIFINGYTIMVIFRRKRVR